MKRFMIISGFMILQAMNIDASNISGISTVQPGMQQPAQTGMGRFGNMRNLTPEQKKRLQELHANRVNNPRVAQPFNNPRGVQPIVVGSPMAQQSAQAGITQRAGTAQVRGGIYHGGLRNRAFRKQQLASGKDISGLKVVKASEVKTA